MNTTTNLATTTATDSVTITSSSGNDATISEATGSAAGVMSTAHHDKLDGIEANATADQTAAEIHTLVESASDSNVFTDADHTKLNGIAAGANNVTNNNQLTNGAGYITASQAFTTGMIVMFTGSTAPSGWAICNGSTTPTCVIALLLDRVDLLNQQHWVVKTLLLPTMVLTILVTTIAPVLANQLTANTLATLSRHL